MSDEKIQNLFQVIHQQLTVLQAENSVMWQEVNTAIQDLQENYQQIQAQLNTFEGVEAQKQHYQNLFRSSPLPSFIADVSGVILEVNRAMASLLKVSEGYLVGKAIAEFVAAGDRTVWETHLNHCSQGSDNQVWLMHLCPHEGEPVAVELHVALNRDPDEQVTTLSVDVYNLSLSQDQVAIAPPH
ncbi:MAG TPA: PAS domain-containing protein [Stenomitos sp.]